MLSNGYFSNKLEIVRSTIEEQLDSEPTVNDKVSYIIISINFQHQCSHNTAVSFASASNS